MDTQTETEAPKKRGRKPKARIEDGQEKVIHMETLKTREQQLISLFETAKSAKQDLSDAVKKCAVDSGLLSKVVRQYITAKAGEKFDERKLECEQLSLVFAEAA